MHVHLSKLHKKNKQILSTKNNRNENKIKKVKWNKERSEGKMKVSNQFVLFIWGNDSNWHNIYRYSQFIFLRKINGFKDNALEILIFLSFYGFPF